MRYIMEINLFLYILQKIWSVISWENFHQPVFLGSIQEIGKRKGWSQQQQRLFVNLQKKVRFVLDEIRNSNINDALAKLSFMNKKAANNIHKTITSAINNMQQAEADFDGNNLFIKEAYVNQGPTMKRFRPAAMGRAVRILKRTSNLTVVISDEKK